MKIGDVKIGQKLFASFGVMVILTTALGIVAFMQIGSMQAQNEMMEKAAEAHASILETRRQEKNYIMREDQSSIDKVAEALAGLKIAADKTTVDKITTTIPKYESAFAELQRLTNAKNEILATCEQDGRDIESAIKASSADQATKDTLIIQLLSIRQAEKNYVMRGDDQYVTQVSDGISSLKADVDAAAMTGAEKSAIKTAADTYQKDFSALVSTTADVNALIATDGPLVQSGREIGAASVALFESAEAQAAKAAATATMYIIAFIIAAIASGVGIAFFVTREITKPINQLVDDAEELAKGNLSHEVTISESKDELGTLTAAFSKVAGAIQKFGDELGVLNKAAAEGKLEVRGDPEKFEGDFAKFVTGVNSTLDSVIGPLNVAAEYVDRISKGDIPEKITEEYKGDFDVIKNNLNVMIDRVGAQISNLTNIPTPVMTIDKDFTVTYMNTVGAKLVGLTPEQCEGKKCYDLFKTPHCQTPECRCAQAMQRDEVVTGETVADPHGLNIPIQYTAAPIKDRDGNIAGALEYVVDIAESKKAMEDAREKVDYLNNIPTPVVVVDKDMTIRFMNPAGAAAVGRTPETCVGQKCFDLFNTPHCNTPDCQVAKAMQQNGIFTSDTIAKLPSGELPIRYTGAPIKDAAGNVVGGLEYVVDISEENQAVADVGRLVEAAVAGKLDARGTPDNYKIVGFRNVIKGINDILDAVVGPVREVMRMCDALAEGDLSERIKIEAKGEFLELIDILNGFGDNLQTIINDITKVAQNMAAGDLTADFTAETPGDFNAIRENLNQATENLSDLIAELQGAIDNVASIGKESASSVQQVNSGMQQISSASQQISKGAQETSSTVNEAAKEVKETNAVLQQVQSNAEESNKFAVESAESAKEMNEMAKKSAEGMKEIQESISDTVAIIKNLTSSLEQVGKTTDVMESIAEQTNLLALNAAIEAARAGEHGRGFAVVAEEVRKLAENSKKSTGDIDTMIKSLQEEMDKVIKATETVTQRAEVGREDLEKAVAGVEKTAGMIEDIKNRMEQIASGARKGAESIEKVSKGVDEIASSSEQAASSSEESSSAVEEQTAAVEQLSGGIQKLSEISEQAAEMIAKFKLKVGSSEGKSKKEEIEIESSEEE